MFPQFSFIVKKPILAVIALQLPVVAPIVVDIRAAAYVLAVLFAADFCTGVAASYFEWKKLPNKEDKWFMGKGEGFSSDKFKKMFIKLSIYMAAPWFLFQFQHAFMIKNFKYETFSEAEFTLPCALVLVFCLNELFSIFHENLPKCGFSLWRVIKKMLGAYKEIKTDITE